jgi:hypothetical protein
MSMRPYWIAFKNPPLGFFRVGVGITAASEAEAVEILTSAFSEPPAIDIVRPIQSFDEVEQNHVAPNMGNILKRGIWFPKGHETAVDW